MRAPKTSWILIRNLRYWLPVILWMGAIFWSSSRQVISTSDVYWEDFILKKSAHFVVYFVLAWFTYRALKKTTNFNNSKIVFWTIIICGMYAVSDEVHQSFVPGRGPHVRDVVIDIVGILSSIVFTKRLEK